MRDIHAVAKDGFSMWKWDKQTDGLALLSLQTALRSYFETYQSMKYMLHLFGIPAPDQDTVDFNHSTDYCRLCAETLVHFQHFFELALKGILREEHTLLAVDAGKWPVHLYRLLKGEAVIPEDLSSLRSPELSEIIERIYALADAGLLPKRISGLLSQKKAQFKVSNDLRNRLWHGGTYILRYPALDELVGRYFLPLALELLSLPKYAGSIWRYGSLQCGVDPIIEIIKELKKEQYKLEKIAFLKELGRAAYSNPLRNDKWFKFFNKEIEKRAERVASHERESMRVSDVRSCPVCGVVSLAVYDDIETDDPDPEKASRAWRYTYDVTCFCCSFSINHHLENASAYGLAIEDYWEARELGPRKKSAPK